MRRTQWLQRSQAVQVINAYAEAMDPKRAGQGAVGPESGPRQAPPQGRKVSGDEMLQKLTGGF